MMAWLVLACSSATSPPPELAHALSAYHEVPGLEELSDQVPDLPRHLLALAEDESVSPLVRTRAWMLFARTPGAGPRAQAAVRDPELPATIRTKVLRNLAEVHPGFAADVVTEVWCDPAPLLRATARGVSADLQHAGAHVEVPDCSGG